MSSAKTFSPSSVLLNAEIRKLVEAGTEDPKEIQATLEKEHPSWKLQERRVSKFTKRALGGDDDSGSVIKRFFSKKKVTTTEATPPTTPIKEDGPEEASLVPTVDTSEEAKETAVYTDDNDGKKEACWLFCNP
mmetsp:Transcript_20467/g.44330  ORF Transcript_20467/g.44330 Transcript_20467/m.44330 type:complete len:133 (+) Transcript_20467:92-490(+)|eukprot:CAMPEP_0168733666 /NCGR_PEP_ID=MMETSP0724-20121128/8410_1 /TAXON_ID=265536 /ORGANISM="Amphiprora sp., Strain CCMP467" /LENGTH=132 /DNA_ID=CAMNT_0008780735 /DNA_START=82 /DNA_END=480 /DNA_ORIENTATION=-